MMNLQVTGDATQIETIHIQRDSLLTHAFRITVLLRFRSIFPLAVHAAKTLRTASSRTSLILAGRCLTVWTFAHITILAHYISHSPSVSVYSLSFNLT
jgi:hypothetical protein